MDENLFQEKFRELMGRIKELPTDERDRLKQLADETRERRERLQGSIGELQDSLDHLRLTVKYLVFDLEATRRENAYMRRMLEQANRRGNDQKNNQDDDHSGAD